MSATWSNTRPARPATVRTVSAEIVAVLLICVALLFAFLTGQNKQDQWCQAHPQAARTAESCPNPASTP